MPAQPITINNWQEGIADSPYLGFASMKLVDIESFPGVVKAQKKTTTIFHSTLSVNFTANAATDVITLTTGTAPDTGTAVTVSSSGTLPAGLAASTNYFVINVSSTTIKLATSILNANSGTAIDITSAGTGTHTIATVNPGTIRHIAKDARGSTQFWLDSNGRVWYGSTRLLLLNGNTLMFASGQGLVVFTNSDASATYLFVFRNAVIDVVNITTSSNLQNPSWTSAWQSLNSSSGSSNSHHAIVGQDNIIYYCDDRYVGTIRENAGSVFDPATGGTYTFTQKALDLPQSEIAQWLEELGTNLLIAGNSFNKIYPWDRVSDTYNLPISVPENSIKKLKNAGGTVYILAGVTGNIYSTQGSYVKLFKKIPTYLINTIPTLQVNSITWGGIAMRNGALIVGVGGVTTSNSGVYLIYPDGRMVLDNIPSTGAANVTALYAETDYYYLGYANGGDYHDPTSGRYSSNEVVIQSQLYKVADKTNKGSYSTLEVQMARPNTGTVRVSYRRDTNSSFTTLTTFTGDGVETSFEADVGGDLTDLENIQIQVELSGSIDLLEVRLIP